MQFFQIGIQNGCGAQCVCRGRAPDIDFNGDIAVDKSPCRVIIIALADGGDIAETHLFTRREGQDLHVAQRFGCLGIGQSPQLPLNRTGKTARRQVTAVAGDGR